MSTQHPHPSVVLQALGASEKPGWLAADEVYCMLKAQNVENISRQWVSAQLKRFADSGDWPVEREMSCFGVFWYRMMSPETVRCSGLLQEGAL